MSNDIKTQYQVQELRGAIVRSWYPVTYLTEEYLAREYYENHKGKKIRLVRVETKEIVIEEKK